MRTVLRSAGNNVIPSNIMLLSCPNCQTEYDVPDAALTGRARRLRCDNCMTTWKAAALEMYRTEPEPAELEIPAVLEPVLDATDDEAQTPVIEAPVAALTADEAMAADATEIEEIPVPWAPERERIARASRDLPAPVEPVRSSRSGLKISVLIVVLIIVVVLLAHRPIGHAWPPSLRLFNALGLH